MLFYKEAAKIKGRDEVRVSANVSPSMERK